MVVLWGEGAQVCARDSVLFQTSVVIMALDTTTALDSDQRSSSSSETNLHMHLHMHAFFPKVQPILPRCVEGQPSSIIPL